MSKTNPKVDAFLREETRWRKEFERLRSVCLGCGLTEELKWGKPCYMFQDSNVVIIQGFKEYCALLFTQGSLLKDPKGVLRKVGEHTQVARQARFTSVGEVEKLEPTLKAYLHEAMEAQKAGLKPVIKKNPEPVPAELKEKLGEDPRLKAAFHALTPGRQRAYILFVSAAKQSATRQSRIEKCRSRILSGKGLND